MRCASPCTAIFGYSLRSLIGDQLGGLFASIKGFGAQKTGDHRLLDGDDPPFGIALEHELLWKAIEQMQRCQVAAGVPRQIDMAGKVHGCGYRQGVGVVAGSVKQLL